MSNVVILVAGLLAFAGGAFSALMQRGPVELAGYRVGLRGAAVAQAEPAAELPAAIVPSSDYRYDAPPSISRETYQAIYCEAGSAACSEAGTMYDVLVAAGLDPAIQAGQAAHETVLGTAGVGVSSIKNMHGVQCHAGDNRIGESAVGWGNGCAGIYATYADSVDTWARLIVREYLSEGRNTPETVVAKYAPAGADGNNPPAYIATMKARIDDYRAREAPPADVQYAALSVAPDGPWGNPLADSRTLLTQGYGVGTHAPAATWGGVDLAWPDVHGAPIHATLAGEARQSTTAMCGNGVEIAAPGWRVLYCHLSAFGQSGPVAPGAVVGYVGNSGKAFGSHLHYEVWRDGVNVNPLEYGALENAQ